MYDFVSQEGRNFDNACKYLKILQEGVGLCLAIMPSPRGSKAPRNACTFYSENNTPLSANLRWSTSIQFYGTG